ncbi:MAG: hypothetical protein ABIY70_09460 [Capsulimonas sp.]|uniref:hypothetical protein n=1 Tax=Capsulimonas sp. TaxID=2494211 RepID=UPI00326393A3
MPQDKEAQHRYEQAAAAGKAARHDEIADQELNDAYLKADSHTGQQGELPPNTDALDAADVKEAYALLEDFTRDALHRVRIVPAGALLSAGDAYVNLHDRRRGELRASGDETVVGEGQYFVAKKDVDYEIWDKLLYLER